MKAIVTILMVLMTCMTLNGCDKEDEKTNMIYPKELDEGEKEIMNLMKPTTGASILKAEYDNRVNSFELWIEVYSDGELVFERTGSKFTTDMMNAFDLAIIEQDIGEWMISMKSDEAGGGKSTMIIDDDYLPNPEYARASSFLDYELNIHLDESQIIGIYYFKEDGTMGHEMAVYSDNEIKNITQYDLLYLIKVKFSSEGF